MSKRLEWDSSKDEDVLYMKKCGVKLSEIAQKLDLTAYAIKNFLARHKRLVASGGTFKRQGGDFRSLKPDEIKRRMTVYEKGGSDKECASELGLTVSCFKSWRTSNNLPMNKRKKAQYYARVVKPVIEIDECFELPIVEVKKERVTLTTDDAKIYNGDRTLKINTEQAKPPTVIVDIGLAEKLAQQAKAKPVTHKLEDRVKARLYSKEIFVEAKRNFGGGFARVGS